MIGVHPNLIAAHLGVHPYLLSAGSEYIAVKQTSGERCGGQNVDDVVSFTQSVHQILYRSEETYISICKYTRVCISLNM